MALFLKLSPELGYFYRFNRIFLKDPMMILVILIFVSDVAEWPYMTIVIYDMHDRFMLYCHTRDWCITRNMPNNLILSAAPYVAEVSGALAHEVW